MNYDNIKGILGWTGGILLFLFIIALIIFSESKYISERNSFSKSCIESSGQIFRPDEDGSRLYICVIGDKVTARLFNR